MSHSYLMRPLVLVSLRFANGSEYFVVVFHVGYELGRC